MSPDNKNRFLRSAALFTLVTFSFQQVSSAQTLQNDIPGTSISYEKTAQSDAESGRFLPDSLLPGQGQKLSSFDFLQQERTLWNEESVAMPADIVSDSSEPETSEGTLLDQRAERSTFEDALAELRPEYASAVILESLSEENIKQLLDLDFEVAVVILAGEIVLLTSGNEDEILTSKPAARILEAAAFTAHTHPKASHIEGPSPLDLKNASGREYVLTDQSAYAYDLFDVEELSVAQFLSEFEAALHRERARYKQNSVMARQQLNRFIKEMDLLNEIQAEAVVFRASEPPLVNPPVPVRVYSAARMAGNFVSIYVNNQSVLTSVGRGFNLAVIDESTGQVLETRTFDTFASQAQSDAMAAFIEGLPQGRYVAVVVHDEGSNSLNQRAKDALKTLGAMDVQNLGWQQSYSLLGRKGLQPGEGMEKRETGNWMALVDAVPYVPSFPENYNVTFQAEHMGGISGWISWSDRWLNTNGMIYKQWQVPQPGGFDLEVVAKGTSEGNVWPLMEVRLNGQVIAGPVSVSQGGYTSYHFTGIPVSAGLHELQIVYTNDQGNRNLAVDRMVIKKSAGSVVQPPSAPTVQSLPAFTNQSTLTLSGSKPAGTSVWINGVERVPASVATSWSYNQSLAAGDGVKNFSILAKDSAGTPSGSVNASITLDQTLPSGSLSLQAGAAYTSSTAVTAALTASDALAGLDQVRYQVNGVWSAWTSFSSTKSITLPAGDNTKTVRYEIRDRAGNVRQLSDTILLDTVAPMLNLSVNAGHAYTNALLVYAALTASDAGSGLYQMRHQIGGGAWSAWTAYAASTQVTLSAGDGSKQIRFEVKDRASNVSSAVTSVTLDTAAPAIIIQSPAIGSDPFVIQESQITIQYTVDGQPKTKQFASLLTGDNPLSIQETDLAGNTTTRNFTIRVVPNVVVGAPTVSTLPAFTNQSSLTLTGTKQAGTSIWINGIEGIPANASTSWSYNDVLTEGDGLKSFSILAKDSAGNTSGSVNISTTLDQTLPAGSVLLYAGAAYTASDSITAALTASDAVSGLDQVRYQVNGVWSAWESFTSSKSLTLNGEDGTKTVLYEVRDKAGNVRQASDTIVLDTTAPAFTLIVNGGNTHTNALTVTVALTASDAGSGLHQMRYQIAGGAWSAWENYAASKEVTLPAGDGSKEIRFELRDNAGNVQAEVSSVTLDTVAPVLATDSMYFHAQTAESGLGGYWSFDDLAGTSTEDGSGNSNHGILVNGPVTSADYPPLTSGNHGSLQFDGVNDYVTTSTKIAAPQEFTISLWFKATGAGGRLIGFGNNQTGDSTGMDRHVFMGNWGHLYFSVYSGGIQMIQSPQGYNDGQWHFLTASMSASGMALYVDGQLKAQKTNITSAGNYEGYWRLGGDNLYSWWNRPYNYYFKGNMDEARVYNRQLSLQEIQTLAQGGVLGSAVPPSAIQSDSLTVSYKLDSLSKSKTFSGLQQGENQIRISETDEAGNNTTLIGTVTVNLSNQSVLPDGTQLFRSSGILQKEITPWGDEIFYRADGSVEKYRFADGREIHYSLGNVNAILFYNAQGVLEETLNPPAAPPSRDNNWVRVGLTGGLSAFYEGQALMEILTETGIRITNVSFDDSGSMKDAFLFYPDGTMDIIRGSKRIRHIGADHSILDYLPSGGAVREIFSDHTDFYHFTKVSQEEILRTYVKSSTGSVTVYDDRGLLSEVRQGELVLYYDRQPDGAAFRLYLNKGISSAPDTKTMIEGSFDSDGTPLWIALKDGTRIYYQSGRLDRVVDSLGVTIDYDFETSGGFVKELTVSRGGASFKYASDGFLQKIETSSGVVTRSAEDADQDGKLTDEQIVEILLDETGGNRLTDFELDPDGNILNGIIITKEGIKQKIENGILTGYETVDGKLYKFHTGENGIQQAELIEWKFRDGTRAIYGGGSISSILFPDGRSLNALGFGADRSLKTYVEESADGTRKNFENGKLKQIFTVSGAVIDFGLDGMAYKVTFADGEAQGIRYLKDPAGTLTEIVFEGSYARRSFGPEGDLLAVLTDGVRAELDNGVLERLFTRYGSVNHPEFNDAGLLSGDILFADGIKQSIRDGLLDSLSLAGGAVINYSEGRIVDLTASEGVYRVHYTDQGAALENATLEFNGGGVSWTKPLIPYLVDHPDSDLARLLLSRALHNALHEREEVQSSFETGDTLFFARLIPDSERGDVYGFGIDYLPYWSGMDMANGYDYSGAVQTSRTLNSWLDAPSQISMLEDINGDGLADRILLAAPGMNYWWVQLNSGQGFLSAVKWTGVDASFNEGALHYQDLLPRIFGTLIDINGDGLPDRVLQSFDGSPEWKIQFNNGSGFNPAVLWGGTAHALQQPSPESRFASEVWEDQGFQIAALTDLDGDGLPDRVLRPYVAPFDRWFWQKNLGDGFADALLWEGVSSSFNQDPKKAASLSGYAEVENNFETPAAAAIRQKLAEWDQSIAHYNTACGNLSGSALHSCRSSAASLMFSAAQRIQDTIRDYGASYYAAYMDDPGVEFYSLQDYERYKNAALYAIRLFQTGFADTNALMDLNGDGLPDRVLLKPKPGQSVAGAQEWWWQKNTGEDFEPAVLWDADVRALPGAPTAQAATSIRYVPGWLLYRDTLIDLTDVNGDGLPDRVTMDRHGAVSQTHTSWWVEVNTGSGFSPAVEWPGIYGDASAQTSIQNDMTRFRHVAWGAYGPQMRQMSAFKDISGDGIPDRVLFEPGASHWKVQLGTGTGFLPVEEILIEALSAPAEVNTSRYDYLHVSLKSDIPLTASLGHIKVTLGDPSEPESYQEWMIQDTGPAWKDYFLPINSAMANADQVHIEYIPAASQSSVPVYVDNLTFTALRPPAEKDWLDRLLAEENVLTEVYSDRNETLAGYLGYLENGTESEPLSPSLLESLMNAETRLEFDAGGSLREFETLYGSVSQVENGRVSETILPNGNKIEFSAPEDQHPQTTTRTVTDSGGQTMIQELSYGRVRHVTRSGKPPLQYSYEFDSLGREITVIFDPDTGVTERYQDIAGQSRIVSRAEANGVITVFKHDSAGERTSADVMYKGRVYETYIYGSSEEGLMTVTTDSGVVEEYDAEGKIRFHTTADGYRYAHSFEKARNVEMSYETEIETLPDQTVINVQIPVVSLTVCETNCEDVHRVSLTGFTAEDGTEASYQDGDLTSLKYPDGTRVFFTRTTVNERTNPETGEILPELLLMDALLVHTDGTSTEYRNGKPYAVKKTNGQSILLETEKGLFINPHESAVFHHAQALKLWGDFVKPQWNEFIAPGSLALEIDYDGEGHVVTRRYAEGVTEVYEDGRILMTVGAQGERLTRYDYDAEGNPVRIELEASRRRLASAVLELRTEVALERQKALAKLAEREQVLNQTIEGEYIVQRDRLLAIKARIEAQRDKIATLKVKGKAAKAAIGDASQQIQAGLDQVNAALEKLAQNRIDALEQLSSQVEDTSDEIETETEASYEEIASQETLMRQAILRHEVSPVIYHWYRKILGRDPAKAEYDLWISRTDYIQGVFNLQQLKTDLMQSPELAARTAEVNFIKAEVTDDLRHYFTLTQEQRLGFASSLGIAAGKLVSLTAVEGESILAWLNSRSLHFGQSAYVALESMLAKAGLTYERRELARRLILVDILTGTLTPLESEDLLISMFALKTVAAFFGLSGEGYAMNYQSLKSL